MAYDRLACELYALVHRGNAGDVQFYESACAGVEDVLELGVGSGRIAVPLARAGHRVTGIEREPEMIALAREEAKREPVVVRRRLTFIEGDIRALSLERRFARILLPNNVLCCLLSRDDIRACLNGVREHLAPGGRVVLDAYRVDECRVRCAKLQTRISSALLVTVEHRGILYDVHEESSWASEPQRIEVVYRHTGRTGGDVTYSIPQRFLRARELDSLLRGAGLRVIEKHGGFRGERYGSGSDHMVIVAAAV